MQRFLYLTQVEGWPLASPWRGLRMGWEAQAWHTLLLYGASWAHGHPLPFPPLGGLLLPIFLPKNRIKTSPLRPPPEGWQGGQATCKCMLGGHGFCGRQDSRCSSPGLPCLHTHGGLGEAARVLRTKPKEARKDGKKQRSRYCTDRQTNR